MREPPTSLASFSKAPREAVVWATFSDTFSRESSAAASCSGESPFSAFLALATLTDSSACLRASLAFGISVSARILFRFSLASLSLRKVSIDLVSSATFASLSVFALRVLPSESFNVLIVFSDFSIRAATSSDIFFQFTARSMGASPPGRMARFSASLIRILVRAFLACLS